MKTLRLVAILALGIGSLFTVCSAEEEPAVKPPTTLVEAPPAGIVEARTRARLLHAAIHGALSVMHRDFFRKGDNKAIPSESLKDVFKSIAEDHGVELRWLASEATIMNVDNKPTDAWQKLALEKVTAGEKEAEVIENGRYRFAGSIPLQNQCLKCHVSDRKSLEDRFAALEISMPMQAPVGK